MEAGERQSSVMPLSGSTEEAGSAFMSRKRARFNTSDDLWLVQAVRRYEPYAAEHGTKIQVWEKIAIDMRASTEKMKMLQITSRAVSDRFQLLLRMHRKGTLKIKTNSETGGQLSQMLSAMLQEVATRMEDVRANRAAGGEVTIESLQNEEGETEDGNTASESPKLNLRDNDDLDITTEPDESSIILPEQEESQHVLTAQLIAIKQEKLRLKKRKLALLTQQHEEKMTLLRQRLHLEERRLHEETVTRKHEWEALLATLRSNINGDMPTITSI